MKETLDKLNAAKVNWTSESRTVYVYDLASARLALPTTAINQEGDKYNVRYDLPPIAVAEPKTDIKVDVKSEPKPKVEKPTA